VDESNHGDLGAELLMGDAPVGNAPVRRMEFERFSIEGYSRAAVQTYWRCPELRLGFDVGAHPWDFMSIPRLFISHTHLDHIAALPAYVARRRMMKMERPVVYLPASSVEPVEQLLRAFQQMDRGRLPCELVPLEGGMQVELSRELVVTVSSARHRVPALCFVVWERRRKLKPQFQGLSGDAIRDLRLGGTEVSHEVRVPLLGYTGDTSPQALDACPALLEAEVLISEMTFVAPEHTRQRIHKHGHMHLDDYVERSSQFKNRHILAGHFSTRYTDRQITRWVDRRLPDRLGGRLHLWL
jgi:ribonuclease Z